MTSELAEARWYSLGEYYERLHRPIIQATREPRTIEAYRSTIKWWERATTDPPICRIGSETVTRFLERLRRPELPLARESRGDVQQMLPFARDRQEASVRARRALSPATVNKHRTHVLAMLDKAGQPSPRNRGAFGIVDSIIWAARYPDHEARPPYVDPRLLDRIYRAADAARYPRLSGVSPADWWRALMFFAYTTGFRRQALFGLQWDHLDLRAMEVHLPPELDKRAKWRVKPLHPINARLLLRIRTGDQSVFGWPHGRNTAYHEFHRIQQLVGIPKNAWYNFHDLKRACGQALQPISELVRDYMLDHGMRSTARYYIQMQEACRQAILEMPLWPAILAEFGETIDSA